MDKRKSHAFGKDTYLLGKDRYGDLLWLESAIWDCGWYWGFGYVETYTNQGNPRASRDIRSHQHWNGLLGKQTDGAYLHHINERLLESVLTKEESWKLSDLMKTFYTLQETAAVLGRGGSHLSSAGNLEELKQPEIVKKINGELLPRLFEEVYATLTPEKGAD